MSNAETAFLGVDGRRLEYAWIGPRPGAGPTLVFLHEGLGCTAMWGDFPERLARATGLSALVYSRLGYGKSDPCGLPRPARFMHDEGLIALPEVLAAAGVGEAILIGHSDGASIALIYAGEAERPGLRGLVLEAPHVFVEQVAIDSIAAIAESYRATDLRAKLARYHGDNTDGAFWGWNRAWLEPNFRDWNIEGYLASVKVPLLVIQGQDDEYGTVRQTEAITAQAGGPVETLLLPACGHAPHRDQADAALMSMARFVRERLAPA